MSLFTHDEVCFGCKNALWIEGLHFWDNKPRFARCKEESENRVCSTQGTCPKKELVDELKEQENDE